MLQNYYNKDTKILTIPYTFNNELQDIPNETEKIIFEQNHSNYRLSRFNQEIKEGVLSNNLTNITFGCHFNQEIKEGVLPNSLINITLGHDFNREIKKGVLPNSLTSITFGFNFNQKIKEGVLPNSLINITFGPYFNKKIQDGVLPNSLINITFWCCSKLRYNIPEHIKTINIKFYDDDMYDKNIDTIPVTIEKIIIDKNKIKFLQKIPYGCMVVDEKNEEIKI